MTILYFIGLWLSIIICSIAMVATVFLNKNHAPKAFFFLNGLITAYLIELLLIKTA